MQLAQSQQTARSDAERREAGSQQANAPQAFITSFNAELTQAQREAIQALRVILAETADATSDDECNLDDDARRTRTARRQRLSLRLRAATALLRVKPITNPHPDTDTTTHAASTSVPTEADAATPAPHSASSNTRPARASGAQPRHSDSPHHRNGRLAPLAAPAAHTPSIDDRT